MTPPVALPGMRHFPLLATTVLVLLVLPTSSAGLMRPNYWEGDGLASWSIPAAPLSNHGGADEAQEACFGTVQVQSYGPVLRDGASVDAGGIVTITAGDGGRYVYPTRIEVIPDVGPCDGMEFRLEAAHSGLDLFDETFDCGPLGCSMLTLSWDDQGAGTLELRVPRADGLQPLVVQATIGTTFVA